MAIDSKYGKITMEFGSVGEDEDVVVFRAQDVLLPFLLDSYKQMCREAGSPKHHLDLIDETRVKVVQWQRKNGCRTPNSNAYMERVHGELG